MQRRSIHQVERQGILDINTIFLTVQAKECIQIIKRIILREAVMTFTLNTDGTDIYYALQWNVEYSVLGIAPDTTHLAINKTWFLFLYRSHSNQVYKHKKEQ